MMKKQVLDRFQKLFGDMENVRTYFAPGRVNLIGEHTDYNGGHVFPCALTIGIYAAARKRKDQKMCFDSINISQQTLIEANIEDLKPNAKYGWANYPLGVVWAFAEKGMKLDYGFDFVIYGNIPNGAGLSSSAALEVLTGIVLRDLYGFAVDNVELAKIGQYSENNFNGMNCGIMDQFASAMGRKNHAIFLDTATLAYEYAPISLTDAKIVVTNSNVKHSLVGSKYNDRRKECETALAELQKVTKVQMLGDLSEEQFEEMKDQITDEICRKRAKHAVYENMRTIKAVQALKSNQLHEFGRLMNASHISLRDDYEVSCEELDLLVETAWKQPGVIGSRMTGGGFGGCTVSIVRNDCVEEFCDTLKKTYLQKTCKNADFYIVDIGDGARILE